MNNPPRLLNQSGDPKPVGSKSVIYNSRYNPVHLNDMVEITDPRSTVINVAVVTDISGDHATIEIVA
jgi:hypothetical protein